MINNEWDILDLYFKNHKYPFTGHHLDSYRNFIKIKIPEIIKSNNPITMIKMQDNNSLIVKIDIYIGGLNGDEIYVDRPISFENGTPKYLPLSSISSILGNISVIIIDFICSIVAVLYNILYLLYK